MADTFLTTIELALKAVLYSKFATPLGMTNVDHDVLFYPLDLAYRQRAEKLSDQSEEDVKLDFINYYKDSIGYDLSRERTAVARSGIPITYTDDDEDTFTTIKAVPVTYTYPFWIWSTDLNKINACIQEYMFWRQTDPNFAISFDSKFELEFDLKFNEVSDQSYISNMFDVGKYFIYRFPLTIEGWMLTSDDNAKVIKKIIVQYYNDLYEDYEFSPEGNSNEGDYIGENPLISSEIIE